MSDHDHPPICSYEDSDYQQSFWEQGGRAYEDAAEAIALRHLLPPSGELLLELGAGAGRNTPRYVGYRRVVLLDYSHTQLEQALKRLGTGKAYTYVAADVYRLPFVDGLFDAATMIRTLHHMANPQAALRQVSQVMRPEGVFILEYANKRNTKAVLRWLLHRQSWNPFDRAPVEFEKLNFDFHPKAVRSWLADAGFHIEATRTVSHFRVGWLKRHVPANMLAALDGILQGTGSFCQYSPSIFVCGSRLGQPQACPPSGFFKCPACGSDHLNDKKNLLTCSACRREYPYEGGIYDFRLK
jgi:ubiquinone/menaquinone biosynthesis C-methylase UbiE